MATGVREPTQNVANLAAGTHVVGNSHNTALPVASTNHSEGISLRGADSEGTISLNAISSLQE